MKVKDNMTEYPGFVAICPDGRVLAVKNTPYELIKPLRELLPEFANDYNDSLREGGVAIEFLEYLIMEGMDILVATKAAMLAIEAKDPTAEYGADRESGKFWLKGEPANNYETE